jgi:hypothetical protein
MLDKRYQGLCRRAGRGRECPLWFRTNHSANARFAPIADIGQIQIGEIKYATK